MKGRNPTAEEKRYMDAICEIGCIVCWKYSMYTPGTVHHTDGKTKVSAHFKSICLCGGHHQISSPVGEWATRHGPGRNTGKKAFEDEYGSEQELWKTTQKMLRRQGYDTSNVPSDSDLF